MRIARTDGPPADIANGVCSRVGRLKRRIGRSEGRAHTRGRDTRAVAYQ
jgi:hypothetical protein